MLISQWICVLHDSRNNKNYSTPLVHTVQSKCICENKTNRYFWVMSSGLTKEEILRVLQEQKAVLRDKYYVTKIGLFGSFARNEATPESDIDFLVEIDAPLEKYIATKYNLHDYLKNLFDRDVDLANPDSLKPFYKDHILKQAVYA